MFYVVVESSLRYILTGGKKQTAQQCAFCLTKGENEVSIFVRLILQKKCWKDTKETHKNDNLLRMREVDRNRGGKSQLYYIVLIVELYSYIMFKIK